MSEEKSQMNEATANAIYDILVEECGAPMRNRRDFVYHQTDSDIREWRFSGSLGFGGKFWRSDKWYVSYYQEHQTPERDAMERAANARLATLYESN